MNKEFNLEQYLSDGVEGIVKRAVKATLRDPKESLFMAKYARYSAASAKLRKAAYGKGENIPPFLIASITSSCNLHCVGCYSRANHACVDSTAVSQLTDTEWLRIFEEARDIGVGFILLAGGEPMIRRDVIKSAGKIPQIVFPIFTNGTMLDDEYLELLDANRNLIPIISIEGEKQTTDKRRGDGVYDAITENMLRLKGKHLMFGSSVTVTTENLAEVCDYSFIEKLKDVGAQIVIFVEYVPVNAETASLAPSDNERKILDEKLLALRENYPEMIFLSFPGDEKTSGGCLAAGRGFFHINSHGGAEPCPFSAYSDINVRDASLKEALNSKLFIKLRDGGILMDEHVGGCVLFEKKELVESLLGE